MATTTNITTTYAGEKLQGFISAATLSPVTIERGGVEVKPNIKFKSVIKTLASSDDLVADGSCDFAATSTLTLDERYLEPKEFQVNLQLCKQDYRDDWDALTMGISAHDTLPPSFADYLMGHVVAKVAEKIEETMWMGEDLETNTGIFDGFVHLATGDSDVVDVASPASGGIDSDNVIAELGKVVDAIPTKIYGKEDLHLYVAPNVARAYVRALGGYASQGVGANGYDNKGNNQVLGDLFFDGVKIFVANGLDDSYVMAAQSSNLYFGTGLLSDKNEAKIIDMADIDGSQNVRVVLRYTAAVNYGIGEEIVLYTPAA